MRLQIVFALVAVAAVSKTSHAECLTPSDQSPGWKQVSLPKSHPTLTAPEHLAQFRTGEMALVWADAPDGYRSGHTHFLHGRYGMSYPVLDPSVRLVHIEFAEPLNGTEVDVNGYRFSLGEWSRLWHKRLRGSTLDLDWVDPGMQALEVVVHSHFRDEPLIRRVRLGQRVIVDEQRWTPSQFRAPHTLYYLHPGNQTIALCDGAVALPTVDRSQLQGIPTAVSVNPTWR